MPRHATTYNLVDWQDEWNLAATVGLDAIDLNWDVMSRVVMMP